MEENVITYGICDLSIVPIRLEPSNTSQMINQLLFGESFEVLNKGKFWSEIKLSFDNSLGFIDNKQYQEISKDDFLKLVDNDSCYAGDLIEFITDDCSFLTTIPLGACLPFFNDNVFCLNRKNYTYEGVVRSGFLSKKALIDTAFLFLNVPYIHGGKSPFGIDASGFVQMVYKLCGYKLPREAKDQVNQGEVLSFIEESEPGDLAFFDNEQGEIIHVGIVMKDYNIIHSYGKVRIDKLDHSGIYNIDTRQHTHSLRMIKKLL